MSPIMLLSLLALFQIKHYLGDFHWQPGWMIADKARYGRPGGLAHAAVHAGLSLPVLLIAPVPVTAALALVAAEFAVHLHIDWAKARLAARRGLTPERRAYWQLLGADQALHQATYLGMFAVVAALAAA